MTSFYSEDELKSIGFKSVGKKVCISRKASFYGAEKMIIGDNVRIDDFCILSGNITLGSNIHISAYVALYGSHGIVLEDYTGVSPYSVIYSAMDDFLGDYLIGPIHDESLTNVKGDAVVLRKYSQVGTHSVIFPGVQIGEGAVVGAMSLVKKNVQEWTIVFGQPAKFMKNRSKKLLDLI